MIDQHFYLFALIISFITIIVLAIIIYFYSKYNEYTRINRHYYFPMNSKPLQIPNKINYNQYFKSTNECFASELYDRILDALDENMYFYKICDKNPWKINIYIDMKQDRINYEIVVYNNNHYVENCNDVKSGFTFKCKYDYLCYDTNVLNTFIYDLNNHLPKDMKKIEILIL